MVSHALKKIDHSMPHNSKHVSHYLCAHFFLCYSTLFPTYLVHSNLRTYIMVYFILLFSHIPYRGL